MFICLLLSFMLTACGNNSVSDSSKEKQSQESHEHKELVVDRSKLRSLIDRAEEMSPDIYTEESLNDYKIIISEAKQTINDPHATQGEIDTIERKLINGALSLEEKPLDSTEFPQVSYENLKDDPKSFAGKRITISGQVLQVAKTDTIAILRLATDGDSSKIFLVDVDPTYVDNIQPYDNQYYSTL